MTGLTGLVCSSQPTQVSPGKPNLYLLSLPAAEATVYLNTEGNLDFVAKYREGTPLHHCVLATSALQSRVQLQQHSASEGYLLAALLALLHLFWPGKHVSDISTTCIWKDNKFPSASFPKKTHKK